MSNPHQIRKIHHLGYIIMSSKIGDWVADVFHEDKTRQEPVAHFTGPTRQAVEETAMMRVEQLLKKK
jgi:hypothetical protein